MQWKWHFTSVVFLPKTQLSTIMIKGKKIVFEQSQIRHILQNTWLVYLKSTEVTKNKEEYKSIWW